MKARPSAPALRRLLHLRRRPLAALFTFVAVLALLHAVSPPDAEGVALFAAASDLPVGTVLEPAHLVAVTVPPDAVPGGAAREASEVVGRTLSAPVTARSILTTAGLAPGGRLARAGFLVVALPLPTGGLSHLVEPGMHLDLLDGEGETVAAGVRVLATPDAGTGLGLGGSARTVLLEVEPAVASRLAALGHGGVTIAVR